MGMSKECEYITVMEFTMGTSYEDFSMMGIYYYSKYRNIFRNLMGMSKEIVFLWEHDITMDYMG